MQEQVQTLVDAGRLDIETGEKISLLEPGVFCLHKSWGPGVIKEWDLFGDKITIDFDGKPGHSMKLQLIIINHWKFCNLIIFLKICG